MSKIPEYAKKVFSWVIFDIYQWEQKLFDGTKTTFEKAKRSGSSNVIPIIWNKLLLTKEQQPWKEISWWLIWWRLEEWETHIQWAQRELLEESWMIAWALKNIITSTWLSTDKLVREREYFIAHDCKVQWPINLDWWEKIELYEVSRDEFIDICCNNEIHYLEVVMKVMHAKIHNQLDDLKKLFYEK